MPLIKPHRINSIEVTKKDIKRIKKDSEEMYKLCHTPIGLFRGGFAVAHCQITDKKPLRFFVMFNGQTIINPEITIHTKVKQAHNEGCLSYSDRKETVTMRWNKCLVKFQILVDDKFVEKEKELKGIEAKVFQHEIDHFNSVYIYD